MVARLFPRVRPWASQLRSVARSRSWTCAPPRRARWSSRPTASVTYPRTVWSDRSRWVRRWSSYPSRAAASGDGSAARTSAVASVTREPSDGADAPSSRHAHLVVLVDVGLAGPGQHHDADGGDHGSRQPDDGNR